MRMLDKLKTEGIKKEALRTATTKTVGLVHFRLNSVSSFLVNTQ